MKMLFKSLFIVIAYFLLSTNAHCQLSDGRIIGGISTMIVSNSGDYELGNQYTLTPSFYAGLQYNIEIADQNFISEVMLEYERINYKNDNYSTDFRGVAMSEMDAVSRNLNMHVAGLYNFKFGKLNIGTGAQIKWTIISESLNRDNVVRGMNKIIDLNNRKIDLKIPLELSYKLLKRFGLSLRYERGLLNRLGGGNGIKEFENTFRFGLKYYIN